MRTSADFDAAAKTGFDDSQVIRQSSLQFDIPYVFRVIYPIVPFNRIFYPAIITDNEGAVRAGFKILKLPIDHADFGWNRVPTVVDKLIEIDLNIRRQAATGGDKKDIQSVFKGRNQWALPVFDRRESEFIVRYFEGSWTIFDGLNKLQHEVDERDKTKLSHGPIWVGDVVITKRHKSDKGNIKDQFNVEYVVKSAKDMPLAGKLLLSILENDSEGSKAEKTSALFERSVDLKVFSDAEFAMVKLFEEEDMLTYYKPHTPTEILEILHTNPIRLNAIDNFTKNPVFPRPEEYVKALMELEIEALEFDDGSGDADIGSPQQTLLPPVAAEVPPAATPTGEKKGDVPAYLKDL